MEIQEQIREQAFKQEQIFKEMKDFVERQEILDERSSAAAKEFDPSTVVLPSVRSTNDLNEDAAFAKACGNNLFAKKEYENALEQYENGLQATDNVLKAQCYFNIGLCYLKLSKEDKAVDAINNAVELDSNYEKAKVKLAKLYMKTERYGEALDLLKECDNENNKLDDDIKICMDNVQSSEEEIVFNEKIEKHDFVTVSDHIEETEVEIDNSTVPSKENVVEPVQETLDFFINENAAPLEFYTTFRESCRHGTVVQLLKSLKVSRISDYFYELRKLVTFNDFSAVIEACKDDKLPLTKRVNLLYALSDISELERICRLLPPSELQPLENVFNILEINIRSCESEKAVLLTERLEAVRDSWIIAPSNK